MTGLYNSPNMPRGTVQEELQQNQPPLGTQFKSYNLNQAVNYYTLDPFQYSITKFDYRVPGKKPTSSIGKVNPQDYKNDPGLIYKGVDFETLLPSFTQTKKSVNDFRAQSYHRFEANDGYFNPTEGTDNTDLWFYGANNLARNSGLNVAGAALNVQEVNHIIFPEPQRGGLNTQNLAKYSSSNFIENVGDSWESKNLINISNDSNCRFFDYNTGYTTDRTRQPFENAYSFDSDYCRSIGISGPYEGSMPFNPNKII
jgi:hypothetical protein